jgi:hypothetical protein
VTVGPAAGLVGVSLTERICRFEPDVAARPVMAASHQAPSADGQSIMGLRGSSLTPGRVAVTASAMRLAAVEGG